MQLSRCSLHTHAHDTMLENTQGITCHVNYKINLMKSKKIASNTQEECCIHYQSPLYKRCNWSYYQPLDNRSPIHQTPCCDFTPDHSTATITHISTITLSNM